MRDASAGLMDGGVQTRVAHDGGDQGFFLQRSFGEHLQSANRHHIVAVNQLAGLVTEQHAVGIAVMGDAQVRAVFPDLLAHLLRVHRAAFLVDVHAVGLIAVHENLGAKLAQDAGCGFIGRAVGAIDHDTHAFERHAAREGTLGVFNVAAKRVVDAHRLANGVGGRADALDVAAENQLFDLPLDVVVEFVAVRTKKFNAVVVIRIVRRGDDDAGVGAQAARDIGDAGGGQRSDEQHIDSHRENARGDGVFEQVTGKSRVLADDDLVPPPAPG